MVQHDQWMEVVDRGIVSYVHCVVHLHVMLGQQEGGIFVLDSPKQLASRVPIAFAPTFKVAGSILYNNGGLH